MPDLPDPVVRESGTLDIPDGCPGSDAPARASSPVVCQFPSNYADTEWRLYPGLYPGGIQLQGGTFYFEPGIYWIGGGGLTITGNGTDSYSVEPGGTSGLAGGVLFFNTELPGSPAAPIFLDGASADIYLHPYDGDIKAYYNIVIYQDRTIDLEGDDLIINGSDSATMDVRGTIYVPAGDVKTNGAAGQLTLDQIISYRYTINGAPDAAVLVLKEKAFVLKIFESGLVE
jgi:hypothetical protein